MKYGKQSTISLLRSFTKSEVTYYELQISHKGVMQTRSFRYSTLRRISKYLPNCQVKFPEPHHFTSVISHLTGNTKFLETRQNELTAYFEAVNKSNSLEKSLGFLNLFSPKKSILINMMDMECPPPPVIKGQKLISKQPLVC